MEFEKYSFNCFAYLRAIYNHWTGVVDWTGGLEWWAKNDFYVSSKTH